MPKPAKQETATAYHEAGHAVVGFWERVPTRLLVVSIVPDASAGTLGHNLRGKHPRVHDPPGSLNRLRQVRRFYVEGHSPHGAKPTRTHNAALVGSRRRFRPRVRPKATGSPILWDYCVAMAPPDGLEPPTPALGRLRSIH
jgi:hypothetical protein